MLSSDVSNFLRPSSTKPLIQNSETSSQNADYISRRTLDKLKLGFLKIRKIKGKPNGERPDKLTNDMLDTKLDPFQSIYKADFGKMGGEGRRTEEREEEERREGEGRGEEERRREGGGSGVGGKDDGWRGEGRKVEERRRKEGVEGEKEEGWEEARRWEERGGEENPEYKKFCSRGFKSERKQNLFNSMKGRCLSGNRNEWLKENNAEMVDRNKGNANAAQYFIKRKKNDLNNPNIQANISDKFTTIKPKMVRKTKNQASYSDKVSDLKNYEPNFSSKNETNSNKFSNKNEPNLESNINEEKEGETGTASKKCEWLSVEEEHLQDVLNSDVFREMGVDPLSLIDENPDYFSHLFCKQKEK